MKATDEDRPLEQAPEAAAGSGPALIEGRGLTLRYRGARRPALEDVSVSVGVGEIVGVVGPNGSGKTTLMACLLGLLRPDAGSARIAAHPSGGVAAGRRLGYLPERLGFDAWMRGRDFVAYHHALAGLPRRERRGDVETALARVGLPREAWERPLNGYSRGMLQRVGLAQALVGRPLCLFLDEPSSGMDPEGVLAVREIIRDFAERGGAVLVNSHQLDQLARLCHRVVGLEAGRLTADRRLKGRGAVAWFAEWVDEPGARAKVRAVLAALDLKDGRVQGKGLRVDLDDESHAADLLGALVRAGVRVTQAGPLRAELEKMFEEGRHEGA